MQTTDIPVSVSHILQIAPVVLIASVGIAYLNGGESSSQFRWFTVAKIEL